ncbi:hypothetical protein dsx2_2153 [Desulfovibrio sp. X2]|nr:hypothetical protein dsx2_2153 [Desulfovibrio sp. X2]
MRRMRMFLQHSLNPLHVYCRLKDCGLSHGVALRVSVFYERHVYCRGRVPGPEAVEPVGLSD